MARLLVVHHSPSPRLHVALDSVLTGADEVPDVSVVDRPALRATASDLLEADAVIVGTTANLGYISGALKHFFDTVYHPCLTATVGLAFGFYVHGDDDTAGAQRAVQKITTGLQWRLAAGPVLLSGGPAEVDTAACWNLGATLALAAADAVEAN